ncbi:hypothetical protein D3C71_936950 [compost metagenome]
MQGQERVIRSVAHLHQRHAAVKRQNTGVAQLLEESLPRHPVARGRLGIGHPQTAEHDAHHDQHQRRRIDVQAQPFKQTAQRDHGDDETDRAPQANLAVARGLALQVRQGDDFELRQHRVPEERMQGHDHRQPGVGLADENQRKGQQRAHRAEAHDGQSPTGVVAQPAPDVRRHAAHQHRDRHQLADPRGAEPQVIEVQRQKRRCRTEQGEIEQIETGEPPVRERRSRHQTAATMKSTIYS